MDVLEGVSVINRNNGIKFKYTKRLDVLNILVLAVTKEGGENVIDYD